MKVLVLATDIYTRGGIARFTSTLASALGRLLGPEQVHVLALLNIGSPDEFSADFKILGTLSRSPNFPAKVAFAVSAFWRAARRYDLIICSHVALAPIAAAIRFLFGTPYWIVCHGSEVWGPLSGQCHRSVIGADRVLAVSSFTAESLVIQQGLNRAKLSVLYNAIPDSFQKQLACAATNGNGHPTILSVGNLASVFSYKGIDTIISVMPSLVRSFPTLKYVVVGDGDDRPRLGTLAKEKGVLENVDFLGSISDAELAEQYHNCTIFALPSRASSGSDESCGEGFGRVYVEAALASKPVLGSSEGGAAEAVVHGRTGFVVDPNSLSEIESALLTLLSDRTLAEDMGQEGQRWASAQFSMTAQIRALDQLVRSSFPTAAGFSRLQPDRNENCY